MLSITETNNKENALLLLIQNFDIVKLPKVKLSEIYIRPCSGFADAWMCDSVDKIYTNEGIYKINKGDIFNTRSLIRIYPESLHVEVTPLMLSGELRNEFLNGKLKVKQNILNL